MHGLFTLPGVTVNTVVPDQLHVCDLGVFGRLMANVAFTAVHDSVEQGPNLQARMEAFWMRIVKHYEPGKRQIGALTLAMISDENKPHHKHPVLKQVKGAEARYMLPAMLRAFQEIADNNNVDHGIILEALWGAADYIRAVADCDDFVPPADVQDLMRRSITRFLQAYAALSYRAMENEKVRWGLVPKHHFAEHLAIFTRWVNPKVSWTYADEDYMSTIQRLVEANSRGTPPHGVAVKVVAKWLVAWDLRQDMAQ